MAAITIDLSRAFDSICHGLLTAKLRAYGLDDNSVKLINPYLHCRLRRVKLNGNFSNWRTVNSRVPQESLLGPLFFNTFINDINFFCDNSSLRLYADDTTLYASNSSLNLLEIKINQDLASISDWLTLNYLTVNSTKTKAIILGNCDTFPTFMLKNEAIEQKECLELLGVTIDSTLSMNLHIKNTLNKV